MLVYKLDRFGRSMAQLIGNIAVLTAAKVRFVSISQGIDTDQSTPTGNLLLNLLSVFAEFEHALISERIRSGLQNRKAQGRRLGPRPKVWRIDKAREMRSWGYSYAKIGLELGISAKTVRRALTTLDTGPVIASELSTNTIVAGQGQD